MDDVLSETAKSVVEYCDWELNWFKFSFEEWNGYFLWDFLPFEFEEKKSEKLFHDVFMSDKDLSMPKLPWSFEKLKELKDEWHEFHLISARDTGSLDYSKEWIDKHFPWIFSSLNFIKDENLPFDNKGELCRHLGVELMIDDSVAFAKNVVDHWAKVLLMDRPWNRTFDEYPNEIKRITSWNEVSL